MWRRMLLCVSDDEQTKILLRNQYRKIKKDGLTYELNRKKINEIHFDFEGTIIYELKTQLDLEAGVRVGGDPRQMESQWIEGVGRAQKCLPMHVIDEYYREQSDNSIPDFTKKPSILNSKLQGKREWFFSLR